MSLSPARDLAGWRPPSGTASVAQSPIQKIVSLLGGRTTGTSSSDARDSLDRMREIEPLTPDMLQNADESIVDMDMTEMYGKIHGEAEANSRRPRAAELECSISSDEASPNVFKQLAGGYISQGQNESISDATEKYAMSDQTCTFALLHCKQTGELKMTDTNMNETLSSDMEMTGTYGHILATQHDSLNDSSMELTGCYGPGITEGCNSQARTEAVASADESMEMTATYGKIVSTTPMAELHCTPTIEVEMEMTGTYGAILSDERSRRSMIPRQRARTSDTSVRFELNDSASSIGVGAPVEAEAEAEAEAEGAADAVKQGTVAELLEAFELTMPLEMPCRRRKSSLGSAQLSASGPMSDETDHGGALIGQIELELLVETSEALAQATDTLKVEIESLGMLSLSQPVAAEVHAVSARI
jgi:hypothetical protein